MVPSSILPRAPLTGVPRSGPGARPPGTWSPPRHGSLDACPVLGPGIPVLPWGLGTGSWSRYSGYSSSRGSVSSRVLGLLVLVLGCSSRVRPSPEGCPPRVVRVPVLVLGVVPGSSWSLGLVPSWVRGPVFHPPSGPPSRGPLGRAFLLDAGPWMSSRPLPGHWVLGCPSPGTGLPSWSRGGSPPGPRPGGSSPPGTRPGYSPSPWSRLPPGVVSSSGSLPSSRPGAHGPLGLVVPWVTWSRVSPPVPCPSSLGYPYGVPSVGLVPGALGRVPSPGWALLRVCVLYKEPSPRP